MMGGAIEPTMNPGDALRQPWDALVIGAGPAGALAARGLALAGARTLLVDRARFPRWKVCGCCLSGLAERTLRDAGLGRVPDDLGASRITRVTIMARGRSLDAPLAPTRIVSREALDAALIREAIEAGTAFMPGTRAKISNDGTITLAPHAEPIALDTRCVVIATGLRSAGGDEGSRGPVGSVGCGRWGGRGGRGDRRASRASHIGLGATGQHGVAPGLPDHLTMAIGKHGYVGFVRLPDGRLNAAAAISPALLRASGGAAPAIEAVLREAGVEGVDAARLEWRGTPPLTRASRRVQHGSTFSIGDAARFVEPVTGEGMAWAMRAGVGVVPHVMARVADEHAPESWNGAHRAMLRTRHRRCAMVSRAMRHPAAIGAFMATMRVAPSLREHTLRAIVGATRPEAAP